MIRKSVFIAIVERHKKTFISLKRLNYKSKRNVLAIFLLLFFGEFFLFFSEGIFVFVCLFFSLMDATIFD